MAEYISRERAIEILKASWQFDRANGRTDWRFDDGRRRSIDDIEQAPAEDVKPVMHGVWLPAEKICGFGVITSRKCSLCEEIFVGKVENGTKFCPNCGAEMEKE